MILRTGALVRRLDGRKDAVDNGFRQIEHDHYLGRFGFAALHHLTNDAISVFLHHVSIAIDSTQSFLIPR